jgi:sulfite exporter TauE/SafE
MAEADLALLLSAVLMGLAGSPHCAAMCGAPCAAAAGAPLAGRMPRPLLALHAGRLVSYAAAGALVAASVAGLAWVAQAKFLQPLWTLLHVSTIALGLWLAWAGRPPSWFASARPALTGVAATQPIRVLRRLPAPARASVAGLAWVALPCGLLQSALLVSALGSGPLAGAAIMAGFALASALGLWLGPQVWAVLRAGSAPWLTAALSIRLAGVMLAAASIFAAWQGFGQALCAAIF